MASNICRALAGGGELSEVAPDASLSRPAAHPSPPPVATAPVKLYDAERSAAAADQFPTHAEWSVTGAAAPVKVSSLHSDAEQSADLADQLSEEPGAPEAAVYSAPDLARRNTAEAHAVAAEIVRQGAQAWVEAWGS